MRYTALPLAILSALLLVVACGDAGSTGGNGQDQCGEDMWECDGECVDLYTSTRHCGACGNVCGDDVECRDGQCGCPGGGALCGQSCVDLERDTSNCGTCGNECRDGFVCEYGYCAPNSMVAGVVHFTNIARSESRDCDGDGTIEEAVAPVEPNAELHEAARAHSEDMAETGNLSHTGSDGSNFGVRVGRTDYTGAPGGENIARGQPTAEAVVLGDGPDSGWINSEGHCLNIMTGEFDEIGVGVVTEGPGAPWWTQVFGVRGN